MFSFVKQSRQDSPITLWLGSHFMGVREETTAVSRVERSKSLSAFWTSLYLTLPVGCRNKFAPPPRGIVASSGFAENQVYSGSSGECIVITLIAEWRSRAIESQAVPWVQINSCWTKSIEINLYFLTSSDLSGLLFDVRFRQDWNFIHDSVVLDFIELSSFGTFKQELRFSCRSRVGGSIWPYRSLNKCWYFHLTSATFDTWWHVRAICWAGRQDSRNSPRGQYPSRFASIFLFLLLST